MQEQTTVSEEVTGVRQKTTRTKEKEAEITRVGEKEAE